MSGSNDPVLRWMRDLIAKRGTNTAELAVKAGLERSRLRKVLAGKAPMLVEELMALSSALELSPADMGLPEMADIEVPEPAEVAPAPVVADPYASHARQLFEMGFALGCNFLFSAEVERLGDSGIPDHVLDQHRDRGEVVLSLDAAHHRNNDPRITDTEITLTLSFDSLYDCTLPWSAIRRVVFDVEVDEDDDDGSDTPEPPEPDKKGPHLRLVT